MNNNKICIVTDDPRGFGHEIALVFGLEEGGTE